MEVDNKVEIEIHNCKTVRFVTLEELLGHLQEALELAPEEHRHNVQISVWSEEEDELEIQVRYERERTAQELRDAFDRNAESKRIAQETHDNTQATKLKELIRQYPKLAVSFVKEVSGE